MKNIALALSLTILMAACSSGTTTSDLPQNVTNRFVGTFQNTPGSQNGNVTLDITDTAGVVTGNIVFTSSGPNCLRNGTVLGTSTGFNVELTVDQASDEFQTVTVVTEEVTEEETAADGTVTETTTTRDISSRTTFSTNGTIGETVTRTRINSEITRITVRTTTATEVDGVLDIQFAASNSGRNLSGQYTSSGATCSNQTGSGTMQVSR